MFWIFITAMASELKPPQALPSEEAELCEECIANKLIEDTLLCAECYESVESNALKKLRREIDAIRVDMDALLRLADESTQRRLEWDKKFKCA
jgi:hypothetical protein